VAFLLESVRCRICGLKPIVHSHQPFDQQRADESFFRSQACPALPRDRFSELVLVDLLPEQLAGDRKLVLLLRNGRKMFLSRHPTTKRVTSDSDTARTARYWRLFPVGVGYFHAKYGIDRLSVVIQ